MVFLSRLSVAKEDFDRPIMLNGVVVAFIPNTTHIRKGGAPWFAICAKASGTRNLNVAS